MKTKEKAHIQEKLSTLYLRLNGYLTTGFIIHSNKKKIKGELDILAIRFPKHSQDDTEHNSSSFLELKEKNNIDFILAEVKSKGKKLKFNKPLRNESANEVWTKILKWIGILNNDKIDEIIPELISLVTPKENSQLKSLKSTRIINTEFGELLIRPIIFSPERKSINNADKFISWKEINDFIWSCLCPENERENCGVKYDFTAWGTDLYEIVKVYKDRNVEQNKFKSIDELYIDIEKLNSQLPTKAIINKG